MNKKATVAKDFKMAIGAVMSAKKETGQLEELERKQPARNNLYYDDVIGLPLNPHTAHA